MTTPSRFSRLSLLLALPLLAALLGATDSRTLSHDYDGDIHLQLVEIGGCQYVVGSIKINNGAAVSIVHHAGCTNPIHLKTP